jgi:hypothetical protein
MKLELEFKGQHCDLLMGVLFQKMKADFLNKYQQFYPKPEKPMPIIEVIFAAQIVEYSKYPLCSFTVNEICPVLKGYYLPSHPNTVRKTIKYLVDCRLVEKVGMGKRTWFRSEVLHLSGHGNSLINKFDEFLIEAYREI